MFRLNVTSSAGKSAKPRRMLAKRLGFVAAGLALSAVSSAAALALVLPPGFDKFQFTAPYHTLNPFSASDLQQIDSGFNVFTTETFQGNGRTCATCHLPEKNFNISADDIQALPAADQAKVLGGTNPVLENAKILGLLGLFNINQGFGAGTEGELAAPLGPFRASMSIGGLGFTTLNQFVCRGGPALEPIVAMNGCALTLAGTKNGVNKTFSTIVAGANTTREPDPREFSLYYEAVPGAVPGQNGVLLATPGDYTLSGTTVSMVTAPVAGSRLVAYFPGSGTAIDDGARDIMLGWAGDGSLKEMFRYAGAPVAAAADCVAVIDDFFTNLADLDKALVTFSLAAVKTHFPRSQNRTPGVDFRCPTPAELLGMARFQEWLGRRFELDITKLVIPSADTETGRRLFSSRLASCVACHVNAGASDNQGRRKLDPVPFLNFSDATLDPFLNGGTTSALEIAGANKASRNGVKFLEAALQSELGVGPTFPSDPGDESLRGGGQGGFSVQSIIEAARKTQFFHNNAVEGSVEDAIAHYFTDNFHSSQGGTAIRNAFRGGPSVTAAAVLAQLEALAPGAINKMGLFLRALSSVYALADCERLVDEMVFRIDNGLSTSLPSQTCGFALNDTARMLAGVRVSPNPYKDLPEQVALIAADLAGTPGFVRHPATVKARLLDLRGVLASVRRSILTTPELP